jgi:hypothetical protein
MSSFDDLLKQSPHFSDVINTHRTATAEILAAFLGPLVKSGTIQPEAMISTLKALEQGTGRPSIDGERRHAVSVIREIVQKV